MRSFPIPAVAGAIVLLVGAMHGARASDAGEAPLSAVRTHVAATASNPSASETAAAPAVTGIGTPVSAESLQSMRGGDDTTTNTVDIHGGVDGNSADNTVSGNNIIRDGSFANASGISTVIQNSGSNVLIQNGTVVNVQFVDPGQ